MRSFLNGNQKSFEVTLRCLAVLNTTMRLQNIKITQPILI